MKIIGKAAQLPLLTQVVSAQGQIVLGAQKMCYKDKLFVYYSYQHPIAYMTAERKLVTRDDWWNRNRADRTSKHVPAILADCGTIQQSISAKGRDFFVYLYQDMLAYGLCIAHAPTVDAPLTADPGAPRRRIKV